MQSLAAAYYGAKHAILSQPGSQSVYLKFECFVVNTSQCLSQPVSQSLADVFLVLNTSECRSRPVSHSLVCFVVNTWQYISQSVIQSLAAAYYGANTSYCLSQEVSQSIASWSVLSSTDHNVSVRQSFRRSMMCFAVICLRLSVNWKKCEHCAVNKIRWSCAVPRSRLTLVC